MRIEITEETGIRHAPYGHMKKGEIREVEDDHGAFFVANGWAKDVDDPDAEPKERGSLDHQDPEAWTKKQRGEIIEGDGGQDEKPPTPKKTIQPKNVSHKRR